MKQYQIAQKWFKLSTEGQIPEQDAFFRFLTAWIAFNALYASKHNYKKGDKDRVQSYANEREAKERHTELLSTNADYERQIIFLKDRGGVEDLKKKQSARKELPRIVRIEDKFSLEQVLLCVYQIRNNLFHGGKAFDSKEFEDLLLAGYVIVSSLIADDPLMRWG